MAARASIVLPRVVLTYLGDALMAACEILKDLQI
jgi:hypothetical protein